MATLMLEEAIDDADLEKQKIIYESIEKPSEDDQFKYALNLVRSAHKTSVYDGLALFQRLFAKTEDDNLKRDSLYYMAIAQTKLNNYEEAIKYLNSILHVQPANEQVKELLSEVNKRMKKDALIGAGIVGSAALVGLVGLVGLGAALIAKKK